MDKQISNFGYGNYRSTTLSYLQLCNFRTDLYFQKRWSFSKKLEKISRRTLWEYGPFYQPFEKNHHRAKGYSIGNLEFVGRKLNLIPLQ